MTYFLALTLSMFILTFGCGGSETTSALDQGNIPPVHFDLDTGDNWYLALEYFIHGCLKPMSNYNSAIVNATEEGAPAEETFEALTQQCQVTCDAISNLSLIPGPNTPHNDLYRLVNNVLKKMVYLGKDLALWNPVYESCQAVLIQAAPESNN